MACSMSDLHLKSGFKLSTLALSISLSLMSSAAFALEALDDEGLADSTGEGIAFLPENASIRLNGADTNNSGVGTFDTGYIRLIPVGPLTTESQDTNKDGVVNASDQPVGKADIYLYGLAISQSNKNYGVARTSVDWNGRFGRTIDSWGSAINPWLLKVATEKDVPNFSATSPTDAGKGDVSYLMLEAPLYHADTDGDFTNGVNAGITGLTPAEKSAYNLKLGLWGDIFVRDPKVAESLTTTGTQFDLGGSGRENRLRLQAVWDGFSLNGSNIKLFQTLGGATNLNGMSTFYNNTLGIAGLLRFNSGDGEKLRASTSLDSKNLSTPTAWNVVNDGCGNNSTAYTNAACQQRVRTRTATNTASSTWTPPSVSSVLRLSTKETTNTGLLATPAINGGIAPTFDPNDGIYLYNPNINLVLGSLYQPLTVGTDGQNITLEIARIPNKESIYKQVYTNYADKDPTTNGGYYGSTCNIYQCGAAVTLGGTKYQGSNATHSSISIGSTVYNATTNTLEAYKGVEAVGISFGSLSSKINSVTTNYRDIQNQVRRQTTIACTGFLCSDRVRWQYRQSDNSYYVPSPIPGNANSVDNRNWDLATGADWRAIGSTSYGGGLTANPIPTAAQNAPILSADNNFGSAVIDGLLIQHMKITTKGL